MAGLRLRKRLAVVVNGHLLQGNGAIEKRNFRRTDFDSSCKNFAQSMFETIANDRLKCSDSAAGDKATEQDFSTPRHAIFLVSCGFVREFR